MHRLAAIPLVVSSLMMSGCGTTFEDRTLSGAGIGAAGGSIIGALTGLSVVEGAAIGALTGGGVGAVTSQEQVNLGEPIWKQHANNEPLVKATQQELAKAGYDPGSADGKVGSDTVTAVKAYQRSHGLLVDGHVSPELLQHIRRTNS